MPCNNYHAVVLAEDGNLFACGLCCREQDNNGDDLDRSLSLFTPVTCPVKFSSVSCGQNHFTVACAQDGTLWAWGLCQDGQSGLTCDTILPTQIPNTQNFISVSCGCYHTIALDSSGFAWGFGYNDDGQLGLNHEQPVAVPTLIPSLSEIQMISCGAYFSLFLDANHRVWGCGNNEKGALGLGDREFRYVPTQIPDFENIRMIASGWSHSLALDSQGQVFGFGTNECGQLGLDQERVPRLSPEPVPELNDCIHVLCGGESSVVHLSDRRVMVFGDNDVGQLGREGRVHFPEENPDLVDKILVLGSGYMLAGDPNGDLLCYGRINSINIPSSEIKLPIPDYLRKNVAKRAIHSNASLPAETGASDGK